MRRLFCLTAAAVALGTAAPAAHAQDFQLTVENIMRGPDLVGRSPEMIGWTPDSRYIYFRWQQPGVDTNLVVYRVRPDAGDPERFEGADRDTIVAGSAEWSRDGRRAIFNRDGELILWDGRAIRRLTRTFERESNPQWGSDANTIYFQRGGNVFAVDLATAEQRQLTDIRSGREPREPSEPEGHRAFLTEQQERLFEFIRSGRYRNQPWNRETPEDSTRPKPFYPGERTNAGNLTVTPDGSRVLMTVTKQPSDTRRINMAVWITDDGFLDTYSGRTKVGDAQSASRAAVLDVATGEVTFVADSVGEGDRDISGIAVSPNSKYALVRVESLDDEDRWWVVVDLATMEERVVAHDHDDAWLGFPGPFVPRIGGFLNDGETVWFGSERSGWTHLYTVPAAGGEPRALTNGEWEILSLSGSPDNETFYLTANREGFQEVHLYALPAAGGNLTRLTDTMGRQDARPSPDGRWLAMLHSEADHPGELYVQQNRAGRPMRRVTESTTEEWRRGPWIKPEIVMITADDGVDVPARLYRPVGDPGPEGSRAAVVFVHGAGYLQNVHNWWSNYYREYMFHHLLASRGYTVLDMDYRASAGHGRDWRTAIHRFMGGRDLDDQVVGAKWLVANMGIDSTRIGMYGGSYGGFITLMAMFTKPGVFAAGAALRPVTDWAHYNDGYTSGILNDPQEDSTAYIQSSPIYHAEGLEGHLLMAHGMVDDNVLFYDTARLAQRLIELGKDNWEVAIYPAERHSFQEASSWRDEYGRILKLFERVLRER